MSAFPDWAESERSAANMPSLKRNDAMRQNGGLTIEASANRSVERTGGIIVAPDDRQPQRPSQDCCAAVFRQPVRCAATTELRQKSISASPGAAVPIILMNDDESQLNLGDDPC
jgi:hypothetical protein